MITLIRDYLTGLWFSGFDGDVPEWSEDDSDSEVLTFERHDPDSDDDKESVEAVESYIRRLQPYGFTVEAVTMFV